MRPVNLYYATNGWMGNGEVHLYVIAENEVAAKKAAREAFFEEADEIAPHGHLFIGPDGHARRYPTSYYENVKVELVCQDTNRPWVGTVSD